MSNPTKLKSTAELLEEFAAIQKMGRESLYRQAAPEAAPTAWGRSVQGAFEPLRQGLNGIGTSVREGVYGMLPEGLRPSGPTAPAHINERENRLLGGLPSVKFPGRGNDTRIANLTPEQEMLLKLLGGSGKVNPYTGLREYTDYGDYGFSGGGSDDDYGGPGPDNGAPTGPAPGEVEANDNVVGPAPAPGPNDSYSWTSPGVPGPAPYDVSNLAPPRDTRTFEEQFLRDVPPEREVVDWEAFQAGKDLKFEPPGVKPGFMYKAAFDFKNARDKTEEWFFGKPNQTPHNPYNKNPAYLDIIMAAIPAATIMGRVAEAGQKWELDNLSKAEFSRGYKDLDPQERALMDQVFADKQTERAAISERSQDPTAGEVPPLRLSPNALAGYSTKIKPYQSGTFALPKAFSPNALTWRG